MNESAETYADSLEMTNQLSDLILKGEARLLIDEEKQRAIKKDIKKRREEKQKAAAVALRERLAPEQQRAMDVAQAKGGSCLVTVCLSKNMASPLGANEILTT